MPTEDIDKITFRCNTPLKKALLKDAQSNGVSLSDLIRQRLSASLSTPYININSDGVINAFNEIDPRLSNPDFVDKLIMGGFAAKIILDLHTQELDADYDVVKARLKDDMSLFTYIGDEE